MPIIVISARSEDTDKIDALDAGADDYLTKPFSVEELLARLRVTQRRLNMTQNETVAEASVFTNGQLRIDYAAGCAYLGDEELHLTTIEYKLLCLLSRNVGKVLTHTFIMQNIWGSCNKKQSSTFGTALFMVEPARFARIATACGTHTGTKTVTPDCFSRFARALFKSRLSKTKKQSSTFGTALFMVEPARFELASEKLSSKLSTSVVCLLKFPQIHTDRQV